MAQQTINVGASPNDGTGTPLRTAFQYTNSNFSELYTAVGPSGNNIVVPGNATITGDLTVDTSTLVVESSTNRVRIAKATAANYPLDVAGRISYSGAIGEGADTTLSSSGTSLLFGNSATWAQQVFYIAGSEAMRLNSTGLGVGRSPSYRLQASSGTKTTTASLATVAGITTTDADDFGIYFRLKTDATGANRYAAITSFDNGSGNGARDLVLQDLGGNVGIGVTPLGRLHVRQTGSGIQDVGLLENAQAAAADVGPRLGLLGVGSVAMATVESGWNGAANTDAYLSFRTRGSGAVTERLRIDSSGQVGIGVTPSAWNSTFKALQMGLGGSAYSQTGFNSVYLASNTFVDSGGNTKYINTDKATYYRQYDGIHSWFNAVSGTAGNAFTATQAMTLDASGNLLVGVTSNPNTARAYFRYDTLTTQPVINSASIVAAATTWNHFVGQSGNGSTVTTNNIFIRGNGDIVNANGIYGTISDLRLKENISDARNYLADLLKLRVVKYSLKEEASAVANKLGFIAQEVEQVFPTMVDTDSEDTKSIKISVLIPMLVKAIQELTARVQTLETR